LAAGAVGHRGGSVPGRSQHRDRFALHLRPSPTDEADHAKIEEFLYTHPDIKGAQVIGVPDPKYGDELCAWIQMRDGATPLTVAAVREFADGKLAPYKIPKYVQIVQEFPMTISGARSARSRCGNGRPATWDSARPNLTSR